MFTVEVMWQRLRDINRAIEESYEEPDDSGWPNTAHMISNVPDLIDENGDKFTLQELALIADTIEDSLKNGDEYCQTVAATFFLEALSNINDTRPEHVGRLMRLLGTEAREYIDAYDQVHGVTPRKWDR